MGIEKDTGSFVRQSIIFYCTSLSGERDTKVEINDRPIVGTQDTNVGKSILLYHESFPRSTGMALKMLKFTLYISVQMKISMNIKGAIIKNKPKRHLQGLFFET